MQPMLFVIGAIMGSAANALIDRLPREESWVKGRSKCDSCKHELGFLDLIPLLSYVILGGKCRYCKKVYPSRNFWVELFTGLSFVVINSHAWSYSSLLLSLIAWVTVIIAVMDWETQLVSEKVVLAWAILVASDKLLANSFQSLAMSSLLGLVVGVVAIGGIWVATKGKAMGFGDVEIIAVMGAWLGWPKIGVAMWLAFVIGAVVGIVKLVEKTKKLKSEIAFGPFLILGGWMALVWGDKLVALVFPGVR